MRPQAEQATEKRERIEVERSETLLCGSITKTSQLPQGRRSYDESAVPGASNSRIGVSPACEREGGA